MRRCWVALMLDTRKIRADFPIFTAHPGLIYLDSAATSQRPSCVIDAIADFYSTKNANVARGLYPLAEEATLAFEKARSQTAAFIKAPGPEGIVFTRNETEAANLVMRGWGERNIGKGDIIVTSVSEHHSDFIPWQTLARMKGAGFRVCDIDDEGRLDLTDFERKAKGARFVALSSASNVSGALTDIREAARIAHDQGARLFMDGAQSVPSMPTDVRSLDCDFLAFSGHKMLAPFGSGILYGKMEALEEMDPFLYGSQMIGEVGLEKSDWAPIPTRFESGTPDIASIVAMGKAISYLEGIGMDAIREHEIGLTAYALERLSSVDGIRILGPMKAEERASLVSFTMEGIHAHDVAALLSEYGICVRSGHHCAMPLHERLKAVSSTRASFYIYNDRSEIDALHDALLKVRHAFKA